MNRWRILLLLLLAAVSLNGFSQRHLVVVDVETLVPVVGANVVSNQGTSVTDSLGHVLVSDSCQSLSFTHVNYESRIINVTELRRDTVYMISKLLNIKEVVVFGKGPLEELPFDMKKELKRKAIDAQLAAANPNSGPPANARRILDVSHCLIIIEFLPYEKVCFIIRFVSRLLGYPCY